MCSRGVGIFFLQRNCNRATWVARFGEIRPWPEKRVDFISM